MLSDSIPGMTQSGAVIGGVIYGVLVGVTNLARAPERAPAARPRARSTLSRRRVLYARTAHISIAAKEGSDRRASWAKH